DVEQESVAFARTAGVANRRIEGDVVALRGAAARTRSADHFRDEAGKRLTQRRAIGSGRGTCAVARFDEAVKHWLDDEIRNDTLLPKGLGDDSRAPLSRRDVLR